MLCCSKADRGILIGRLLQVNRYLHIGPPISTAPRVASTFAGRGAASAASIGDNFFGDFLFEEKGGEPGFVRRPSSVVRRPVRQNKILSIFAVD